MNRELINEVDLMMWHRKLRQDNVYFVAGSSSLWVPSQQLKLIVIQKARLWPDLDGKPVFMTPGEAARVELARAFPNLKRVGWKRGHIKHFDWRPPMYYAGPVEGDLVGYDLTSAYWQVYRPLWLNVAYPRGFGTLSLKPAADNLRDWKQARNAVMGITRSRTITAYKEGKRIELSATNPYLSPHLWATTQSVLHDIAAWAIRLGAVYINTDSYIFPDEPGLIEPFLRLLDAYELSRHLECRGRGRIIGWNNYSIGTKQTGLYAKYPYANERKVDNVQRKTDHLDWWFRSKVRSGCQGFQV